MPRAHLRSFAVTDQTSPSPHRHFPLRSAWTGFRCRVGIALSDASDPPSVAGSREVAFTGRLVYREWTADDGSRRSKHSAIGRVEFIGSRPVPQQAPTTAAGEAVAA